MSAENTGMKPALAKPKSSPPAPEYKEMKRIVYLNPSFSKRFLGTAKITSLAYTPSALQGALEFARVEDALRNLDEQGSAGTDARNHEPLVAGGGDHREEVANRRNEHAAHRRRYDAGEQDPLPGRQRS